MIHYKKSMFGFGANSCINPTKGDENPKPPKECESDCSGCAIPKIVLGLIKMQTKKAGQN